MFTMIMSRPQMEIDIFMACLGQAIRDHRWAMKLSQRQVAVRAGIDPSILEDIEAALAESISLETLTGIAQALHVPPSFLMKQAEERMKS